MSSYQVPAFLAELLHARSPSGYEGEAQAVFDRHVKPAADAYTGDALGNRLATLNPDGDPVLMLAGHMDELGLILTYVNKEGFLYFDTIGGHDLSVISGRRVIIQTAHGLVKGVTGKRAFDNKVGAYIVGDTLIRLSKEKKKLAARLVSVATSQEEIGTRGATTSTYAVNPHIALAVDVGHATDHPDCDNRKFGETKLSGDPILCRGANINPKIFDR